VITSLKLKHINGATLVNTGRKEAEAKAEQERIDKENTAREEEAKPDREKIIKLAEFLGEEIPYPTCKTDKGKEAIVKTQELLNQIATSLYATAKRKRW